MDVQLLYIADCPNWRAADDVLRQALDAIGAGDVTPVHVDVTSPEQAELLGVRGSPTFLIDGRDPFADASAPLGLACRVFATPDGLRGAPTVAQLVAALSDRP